MKAELKKPIKEGRETNLKSFDIFALLKCFRAKYEQWLQEEDRKAKKNLNDNISRLERQQR